MMSVRNSGRHIRLARTSIDATVEDLSKKTDPTPQKGLEELQRTITITPAANQFVIVRGLSGDVAFNGTIGLNNRVRARLTSKLPNDVGLPTVAEQVSPIGPASSTNCTTDTFTSGSRTVEYQAPLGEAVDVDFYLHYIVTGTAPDTSTVTSICLDDTIVTYDLITHVRRT